MQKEAQIDQMARDGSPLGAIAAALASPETAERIALMAAATSGALSPLDAARLSLQRAGQDSAVLAGLAMSRLSQAHSSASTMEVADDMLVPLGLGRRASSSAR
jgi:hypothetical protein